MRMPTGALLLLASVLAAGCASFSVLAPAKNATVSSPAHADVYWNAEVKPGTLKILVDQNDVTGSFAAPDLAADRHALGTLGLAAGPHVLRVSGDLWDGKQFTSQSAEQPFQVSTAGQAVTYTMTVRNFAPGWPQGTLGNFAFGGTSPHPNVHLVFTFEGNTADVVPYHVPTSKPATNDGDGFEIIAGSAHLAILDAGTGATLAQADFLPGAGIFVSVDNGNRGIGFGCKGALPGDPTFPNGGVEVAYPYAQFSAPMTDLKSNYTATATWALSCAGFSGSPGQRGPGTCNVPPPLATTAGLLTITSNDQQDVSPPGVAAGIFTTVVH